MSTTASARNWRTMSRRRAPMALRTPISRVRSVTDTSMMFITPMPPTSRPMELSTTITSAVTEVSCAELLDHLIGGRDREIVGRGERHVALAGAAPRVSSSIAAASGLRSAARSA